MTTTNKGAYAMKFVTNDAAAGDFANPEPGMERAVLTRIIDQGTQKSKNPEFPDKRSVMLTFELEQKMADGRPFVTNAWLNMSWHEKSKMRKMFESWRGKPFAAGEEFVLKNTLGKSALLNITVNDRGYAAVVSVNPLPKGMEPLPATGELVYLDLDEDYDAAAVESLSERQHETIGATPEYKAYIERWHASKGTATAPQSSAQTREAALAETDGVADFDDDLPF
jgi:hypothetical protein